MRCEVGNFTKDTSFTSFNGGIWSRYSDINKYNISKDLPFPKISKTNTKRRFQRKVFASRDIHFFFTVRVFFHEHCRLTGQQGRGECHLFIPLYHFHPLINIQAFIFQLCTSDDSHIFNRTACIYQAATRWDLHIIKLAFG